MKAVVISNGEVSWEDRPDPVPAAYELLLEVAAAGLNGADLLQKAGRYPPPPGTPLDQPGMECSGTVVALGPGVRSFRAGDQVMALVPGAAQAELVVVHERLAMPVPAPMSLVDAGGFPEVFATAHDALFTQAGLAMGERLLVTGAAGGVGTAAIQLAVATGAQVVASARDVEAHRDLAALGAECVLPEQVPEVGPFNVVLELVGGPSLPLSLSALAPWGRVVVIGIGAGARSEVDLRELMARRATVRASTLRNRTLEERATVLRLTERHVLPLVAAGKVRVITESTFAFSDARRAYERFAAGRKLGKVLLARG